VGVPAGGATGEVLKKNSATDYDTVWGTSGGGQLPVGSIYINKTDPTNPATLLGYGTWQSLEGFVLVGYKPSDPDFGTAE